MEDKPEDASKNIFDKKDGEAACEFGRPLSAKLARPQDPQRCLRKAAKKTTSQPLSGVKRCEERRKQGSLKELLSRYHRSTMTITNMVIERSVRYSLSLRHLTLSI